MPFVERRRQAMNEDFNKEKSATLIEEARAITAELRSEITILEAQMRQVLDGREMDADEGDEADFDPREVRGEQVTIAAAVVNEVRAGRSFWRFWR
jgi:hypothetical protein